ncbi:MAG: site-specific integrase [Oscillospiraceae bacterium]|jgi:integrase|nr:site-specific integrase [Oscillospiraceae bacterium]
MAETKKRANGEGSWKKRKKKNGEEYLEYRVSFGEDMEGYSVRKSFYGKTQKECKKQAKDFEKSLNEKLIAIEEYTVGDWLEKWLTTYKKDSGISDATYKNYKYCVGIIKKHKVSNMQLVKVKPMHITQFYNDNEKYSASVLNKFSILLFGAFDAAIDNDLCYKNPAKKAKKLKKASGEKTPFSPEATQTIKEFAKTDSEFGTIIMLMLCTGLRPQEIRALHWKNINLKEKYILVDTAIKRNGVIGLPKGNRIRIVPIKEDLIKHLKPHIQSDDSPVLTVPSEQKRKRRGDEGYETDGIHLTDTALRTQYTAFFIRLNKYLAENKKEPVVVLSPHSMRHTYATELATSGVSQKAIQLILGHADMSTTDGYTHLSNLAYLKSALGIE